MGALLNQLEGELINYINDHVRIRFYPNIAGIQLGQRYDFEVYVINDGPLDMRNAMLQVWGSQYMKIGRATTADNALEGFISEKFDLVGRNVTIGPASYRLALKGIPQQLSLLSGADIIGAQIFDWEASLTTLLFYDASYGNPVSLKARIFPQVKVLP